MKRRDIDIRLLKNMGKAHAYLCQRLYSWLERHHGKYETMAYSKNKGCVSASLRQMCKGMGIKNNIKSRYLVMYLKKKLWVAGLIAFDNSWQEGEVGKAGRFAFIARIKETLQTWKEFHTSREEDIHLNCQVLCSCWNGLFDENVIAKLAVS